MAPSDAATEQAYEIVRQKSVEEPSLPATVAKFLKSHDASETLYAVLVDEQDPAIIADDRYQSLRDLCRVLRGVKLPREKLFRISINILTNLANDSVATNVLDSVKSGGTAVTDSVAGQSEGDATRMEDSETHKRERMDVAALLGLPSLRDAVDAVARRQRISFDPANRLPEEKVVDEHGGFSLEIPRHKR